MVYPMLFYFRVFFLILLKFFQKFIPFILISIIIACSFVSYPYFDNWVAHFWGRVLLGFCFVTCGYYLIPNLLQKTSVKIAVPLLIISLLLSVFNGRIDLCTLQMNNQLFFFLDAVLISLSLLKLTDSLGKNKILVKAKDLFLLFGMNSITILCTHNILIEIIRLLDYKITGDFLSINCFGSYLATIIVLALEVPLILLLRRPGFCLLVGKK